MNTLIYWAITAQLICPQTKFVDEMVNPREPAPIDYEIVKTHKCAERFKTSVCLRVIALMDNGHRRLLCGPKVQSYDEGMVKAGTDFEVVEP